jgi:hypothetical protein
MGRRANTYWGGLDDDPRDAPDYPTHFRVNAALQTVADLGGTVVPGRGRADGLLKIIN